MADARLLIVDEEQRVVFDRLLNGPRLSIDLPLGASRWKPAIGEVQRRTTTIHAGGETPFTAEGAEIRGGIQAFSVVNELGGFFSVFHGAEAAPSMHEPLRRVQRSQPSGRRGSGFAGSLASPP